MAKANEGLQLRAVEPQGEVRIDMAKEDLVTVGLVEIENELLNRHQQAKLRCAGYCRARDEAAQEKQKQLHQWAERAGKEVLTGWRDHLRILLGTSRAKNVTVKVTFASGQVNATQSQSAVVQLNETRELIPGRRQAIGQEGQAFSATYGAQFDVPQQLLEIDSKLQELAKSINTEEALIMDIKHKLGNMNRYERQLRAELVKARLGSTEEGRALLAVITQNLTERIGLPALS